MPAFLGVPLVMARSTAGAEIAHDVSATLTSRMYMIDCVSCHMTPRQLDLAAIAISIEHRRT
jgi:hypothetical protein